MQLFHTSFPAFFTVIPVISLNGIFIATILLRSCFLGAFEMSPHRQLSIYLARKKEEKT